MAYLDYNGLKTFWNNIKNKLAGKQDKLTFDSTPTASSTNPVTSGGVKSALDAKANLASPTFTGTPKAPTAAAGTNTTQIATTAFVKTAVGNSSTNLDIFKTVKVGDTSVSAANNADTLTIEAGNNVTITPDATNKKVTITATDTTYSAATQSENGLMSSTDKKKLDEIAAGAEVNVVKSVDTTAGTSGISLSLTSGKLDVTITSGSVASGNANFVTGGTVYSASSPLAPKASPTFTGTPKAPTANAGTSTEQIATTAFVSTAVGAVTTSSLGAVPTSEKGVANGVATLDANGLVPTNQLPSFVDDVIEAYARSGQTALSKNWLATGSASGTVIDPEAGKIYVLMADSGTYTANSQFRWGGTAYVKLNDGGVSAITNAEIDSITNN